MLSYSFFIPIIIYNSIKSIITSINSHYTKFHRGCHVKMKYGDTNNKYS